VTERPCKACGVPLRFVRSSVSGRTLPLQRIRTVYQVHVDLAGEDEARALAVEGFAYVWHFETCPSAGTFSRPRIR